MKEMKTKSEFYVRYEEWRDNLNKLDVAIESSNSKKKSIKSMT